MHDARRTSWQGRGHLSNVFTAVGFRAHVCYGLPAGAEQTCLPEIAPEKEGGEHEFDEDEYIKEAEAADQAIVVKHNDHILYSTRYHDNWK
eukprot:2909330-Lingulodinium_polyedra.AAC.1